MATAKWLLLWQYVPGSIPLAGMTHAQTRQHLKLSLDWWTRFARDQYGCDISHRQRSSGNRIRISFGFDELHLGSNTYALGLVKSSDKSRIWLFGDYRRDILRDVPTCGRTTAHELGHCFSWKARPAADKYGHSPDRRDVYSAGVGSILTTSLPWWRGLGGTIKGWKPKAAAASDILVVDSLESMLAQGDGLRLVSCGCLAL